MSNASGLVHRTIRINVIENRTTHLLVALSPDLPGLMLAARTEDQIERELSDAIKEVLEAEGRIVLSVTMEAAERLPADFVRHAMVANAELAGERCN